MKTNFPVIQEDRQKAYTLLVNSGINWTLVRVPFIDFNDVTGEVSVQLFYGIEVVEDCQLFRCFQGWRYTGDLKNFPKN